MLRRRVRVSEHYRIPWSSQNMKQKYEFYDQSRDTMFQHTWKSLQQASFPTDRRSIDDMSLELRNMPPYVYNGPGDAVFEVTMPEWRDALGQPDTPLGIERTLIYAKVAQWMGLGFAVDGFVLIPRRNSMKIYFDKDQKTAAQLDLNWDLDAANPAAEADIRATIAAIVQWRWDYNANPIDLVGRFVNVAAPEGEVPLDGAAAVAAAQIGAALDGFAGIAQLHCMHTSSAKSITEIRTMRHEDVIFPADLFILRPNIEHYMLGVIMGRGGGPEELGATFWGQTELSCYDDAQHGIWGMSYKYHERAIVTNEKNLIRVFDVCFDGYCGGNDASVLRWNNPSIGEFKQKTTNLNAPYQGPSMVVMSLPVHTNSFDAYPNPLNFHPTLFETNNIVPDRGLRATKQEIAKFSPFIPTAQGASSWADDRVNAAYNTYYTLLGLNQWHMPNSGQAPGALASQNESEIFQFSFHGQMNIVDGFAREEIMGSGHLGPSFVGVASVREGRGQIVRGPPKPVHIM